MSLITEAMEWTYQFIISGYDNMTFVTARSGYAEASLPDPRRH